eukprot:13654291-Alexandrium_andersonii.AAC.1
MSASLVGSEMCIRDRFTEKRHKLSPDCIRTVVTISGDQACDAPSPPCLLYTSDAADDMQ